jgi:hypothetical protein
MGCNGTGQGGDNPSAWLKGQSRWFQWISGIGDSLQRTCKALQNPAF